MRYTKITLAFKPEEMEWVDTLTCKYFGYKKHKTKKDSKLALERFVNILTSKGFEAVEENRQYIEVQ